MDFELGIVCGACDAYNAMGQARCAACSHDLALDLITKPSTPQMSALRLPPNGAREPADFGTQTAILDAVRLPLPSGPAGGDARSRGPEPTASEPQAPPEARGSLPSVEAASAMPATLMGAAVPPAPGAAPGSPVSPASPASPAGSPNTGGIEAPGANAIAARVGGRPAAKIGATTQPLHDTPRNLSRPPAPDLALNPPPSPATRVTETKAKATAEPARPQPPSYAHLTQDELMEQARHYLCWSCYAPVPKGHKFCGRCGAEVPAEIIAARTLFFGDMQTPGKARLILIRGEGLDGLSFYLKIDQHIVGRKGQIEFPDDPFVSTKHANFFYRNDKLFVRDEGSLNGVYVRIRGSVDINPGDTFLAGEQVFRLDPPPAINETPDHDGTYFYTSPKYPSTFRLAQLLQGGAPGMTACARGNSLQLGREGGDLNFPADIYMSSSHCRIEEAHGRFSLTDLNSRNGTYIRIKSERELTHGDYLFIGRKLLRVELNS